MLDLWSLFNLIKSLLCYLWANLNYDRRFFLHLLIVKLPWFIETLLYNDCDCTNPHRFRTSYWSFKLYVYFDLVESSHLFSSLQSYKTFYQNDNGNSVWNKDFYDYFNIGYDCLCLDYECFKVIRKLGWGYRCLVYKFLCSIFRGIRRLWRV